MTVLDLVQPYLFSAAFIAWPYLYIRFKHGRNRELFVCSVVGTASVVLLLLSISAAPFGLFLLFLAPDMAVDGLLVHAEPLLEVANLVAEWGWAVGFLLFLALSAALPSLIWRRYEFFRNP